MSAWIRGTFLGLLCALLASCASVTLPPEAERPPPLVTRVAGDSGLVDLRGQFRATLCALLADRRGRGCESLLTRMGAEPAGAGVTSDSATLAARFRLAIVPGFLAECLAPANRPFAVATEALRADGFDVTYLSAAGRGRVEHNALQLAAELAALPEDPRPLVIIAYSKGLPDMLAALADRPTLQQSVAAVVSLAGAANGSLLAERYESIYRVLLSRLPLGDCDAGDGSEIHDLRRDVRHRWWQANGRRITVPIYSLVAVPEPERVSTLLRPAHARLSELDPFNDGQLLWTDAVAVPGALLGYINADHWGIAMRLSSTLPGAGLLIEDDVPRVELLLAALAVIDARIGPSPAR